MMKSMNIINHTHWDREWYQSYETFRGKLTEAIKAIIGGLDSGQYKNFMLDGQTIIMEDLKQVLEDDLFKRLENYINQGKIQIGPWYVLPDEFLVSGESLIRNLKIGMDISKQYNVDEFIGYLPDTFGHIGQLPQIFKGVNIDWLLLFRGVNSKGSEVNFIGSDETEIKTLVLPLWEGYYNHFLSYDDYRARFITYLDKIKDLSAGDELLLLNGADHLVPHPKLNDRLQELEKEVGVKISQTSLLDYTSKLNDLVINEKIYGEQRDERKAYILTNVASSRSYLKVQNQELEDRLTNVVEPLEVIKSLDNSDSNKYKHKYINNIWKTLLENHPHDSICGCSIDDVHQEMVVRNKRVRDMQASIVHYVGKELISKDTLDNKKIYVFNPHPYDVEQVIEAKIVLPSNVNAFEIRQDDKKVPMKILNKIRKDIFLADVDLEPNWYEANEFHIAFEGKQKGIGFTEFEIVNIDRYFEETYVNPVIENDFIKLWVNNQGYINILNKEENVLYENTNMFVSTLDVGDEYTYSPPIKDKLSRAKMKNIDNIINNDLIKEIQITYDLEQPEEINSNRTAPSKNMITSQIVTKVKLLGNSKTVEFESRINNKAKDHRLRAVFPLGKKIDKFFTDVSFDNVERKPLVNITYDAEKQKEVKVNTYPTDSYAYVENAFGIIHKGLQEVEVTSYDSSSDAMYLSVMRSVGWLSRDDIRTRGGGAGPKFETPDAQCLGEYTFNYALTFEEQIPFEARKVRVKPVVFQGNHIKEGLDNILCLDNKNIIVSAFYKNEADQVILRLFNPTDTVAKLKINSIWKEIYEVDLLDREIGKKDNELIIGKKKIITLKLK